MPLLYYWRGDKYRHDLDSGEDSKENLVLICPNHHAAIHYCDAPFDYQDLAFAFGDYKELLQLNRHDIGL
jgi:hypothetical protein